MQRQLLGLASAGATRNALTKAMVEELVIPVPDIEEQREIARRLTVFDQKIQLNQATVQTLVEVLAHSYRQHFGKYLGRASIRPGGQRTHSSTSVFRHMTRLAFPS